MRPHRLRLQAFGSFADEVNLDLDALGEQGLVLLTGDTGSGKTTLLDALGFALYGTVVGERSKAKDLRSHHAADGVEPWVDLEFTARGKRMRVRRWPAWSRAGKTDVNAKGQLWERVDGVWIAGPSKLQEIGHELSMLLGMSAEQFHSVVVLPQGRFATFLQASSNEREALLKKLFLVERFEFVQDWLASRARAAEEKLAVATVLADGLAGRVAQVDGTVVPPDRPPAVWAAETLAAAVTCSHQAQAALRSARRAREVATAEVSAVESLQRRQQLRLAAEQQLRQLIISEPTVTALREAVVVADRARPVLMALVAAQSAASELDEAVARCSDFDGSLIAVNLSAVTPLAEAAEADSLLGEGLDAALHARGRLSGLTDVASQVSAALLTAAQARARGDAADRRVAADTVRLAELPSQLRAVADGILAARTATTRLPELRIAVQAQERLSSWRSALTAETVKVTTCERLLAAAEVAVANEAALEQELRNRRIDAVASELAAYLADGTPCPTCGSLDHPEPAEVWDDDVTRDQERAAAQRLEAARAEQREVLKALSAAQARVDALAERIANESTAGELPSQGLLDELTTLAGGLDLLVSEEQRLHQEQTALQVDLAASRAEAVAAVEAAAASEAAATSGQARLDAETQGMTLAQALAQTELVIDVAGGATKALLALGESRRVLARAQASLAAVVCDQGFESAAEAQKGALNDVDVEATRRTVADHDAALSAVNARLADPDLAVETCPAADTEGARGQAEQALKVESSATADSALADRRLEELSALVPELLAAVAARGPLRDQANQLRELAEVAAGRGANKLRMPLASFVLAARLEEVAEAASVRLELMSAGRYSLVHSDTGRDGRARAGLALQVEDGWTGRRRDTATLSGGETFMAALALALGLADVVTAETGGASIDALFVDEGFGSLDPDTLDKVMDVLDSLRSGGRLVGVVSHVAEMRQRIPAQVHVAKGIKGSSLATTVGPPACPLRHDN